MKNSEDIHKERAKEWEKAWKEWADTKRKNNKAGTKTITIGDTITINVPATLHVDVKTIEYPDYDWQEGVE